MGFPKEEGGEAVIMAHHDVQKTMEKAHELGLTTRLRAGILATVIQNDAPASGS
jgi:ABC-type cobalamin transport system ATPase subunit